MIKIVLSLLLSTFLYSETYAQSFGNLINDDPIDIANFLKWKVNVVSKNDTHLITLTTDTIVGHIYLLKSNVIEYGQTEFKINNADTNRIQVLDSLLLMSTSDVEYDQYLKRDIIRSRKNVQLTIKVKASNLSEIKGILEGTLCTPYQGTVAAFWFQFELTYDKSSNQLVLKSE